MCPCNPAHIQNHFLHHFGLEMTGCVRRPVSKLLEHLKVLEELRNEVRRTQQLLLSSSFYRVFFFISIVIIILFLSSSLISSHLTQAP